MALKGSWFLAVMVKLNLKISEIDAGLLPTKACNVARLDTANPNLFQIWGSCYSKKQVKSIWVNHSATTLMLRVAFLLVFAHHWPGPLPL